MIKESENKQNQMHSNKPVYHASINNQDLSKIQVSL